MFVILLGHGLVDAAAKECVICSLEPGWDWLRNIDGVEIDWGENHQGLQKKILFRWLNGLSVGEAFILTSTLLDQRSFRCEIAYVNLVDS